MIQLNIYGQEFMLRRHLNALSIFCTLIYFFEKEKKNPNAVGWMAILMVDDDHWIGFVHHQFYILLCSDKMSNATQLILRFWGSDGQSLILNLASIYNSINSIQFLVA